MSNDVINFLFAFGMGVGFGLQIMAIINNLYKDKSEVEDDR